MQYFINLSILYRNRNFGLLFIGQLISFIGTMITSVALPYQIYHETHSTFMVGILSFIQLIPLLFTALWGGVLADKHHRRTLLLIAESLLAIGCLILALNSLLAFPYLSVIFITAAIMSAITGLHRPALDSLTQQLIPSNEYSLVSGLTTFTYSGCMIIGPALGGLIIAHFGISVTYFVDFASFLFFLIILLLIKHIPKPQCEEELSTWSSLKEGFKYAASRQELLGTYFVDFAAMIFGMPMALFPAIAQSYGGAKTLGLLYSAPAVGALIISLFSGWTAHVKRYGVAITLAASLWGVAIVFFGLAHNLWLALFFLALAGAFDAISGIFRQTLWNMTVPQKLRGRLAGIEMISYLSGPRLGDTEAGIVAAAFGITTSIVSGGILCVAGVAICCYFLPKFWHYRIDKQNS